MFNLKMIPMKALKITLLVALFVAVSSQTNKKPVDNSANTYETTKPYYDLMAHNKAKVNVPEQG